MLAFAPGFGGLGSTAEKGEMMPEKSLEPLLRRIADALERLAPLPRRGGDLGRADAYVWHAEETRLTAVDNVSRVPLSLIRGLDRQRDVLLDNTKRFASALPANNALLWGARGMGKSSLVKAVHAAVNEEAKRGNGIAPIVLVEIHREDIATLPKLLEILRASTRRIIIFCDDLSFDNADTSYKSLKAVLEGGIEGRPPNVLLYATSNRRHLMPRDMIENERSTAINPSETVDEKVSLSDRFGLWLGFHVCDQDTYFEIVEGYAKHFGLKVAREEIQRQAGEWALTRGARSGRVAWQFIQDLAGRLGRPLD